MNDYPATTGDGGPLAAFEKAIVEKGVGAIMLEVVAGIEQGKSLIQIAREHRYPRFGLGRWIKEDPERVAIYNEAMEIKAEFHADCAIDAADNAGVADVQVAALQAKVHQWAASKYHRQQYGDDKMPQTLQIGNGASTISVVFVDAENGKPTGNTFDAKP